MTETTLTGAELRDLRSRAKLSLGDVTDEIKDLSINELSLIELGRKDASDEKREEILRTIRAIARKRAEAVGAA